MKTPLEDEDDILVQRFDNFCEEISEATKKIFVLSIGKIWKFRRAITQR